METQTLRWIPVSEALPKVDSTDKWNSDHKISKRLLTYSEFGMRFGTYFHLSGHWSIDGVHSTRGIKVEYWMDVPKPEEK